MFPFPHFSKINNRPRRLQTKIYSGLAPLGEEGKSHVTEGTKELKSAVGKCRTVRQETKDSSIERGTTVHNSEPGSELALSPYE